MSKVIVISLISIGLIGFIGLSGAVIAVKKLQAFMERAESEDK